MQTAGDMLRLSVERTPEATVIVDASSGRRLSCRAFRDEIEQVAAGLAQPGIGPDGRFATVLPKTYEHCLVLLACSGFAPCRC